MIINGYLYFFIIFYILYFKILFSKCQNTKNNLKKIIINEDSYFCNNKDINDIHLDNGHICKKITPLNINYNEITFGQLIKYSNNTVSVCIEENDKKVNFKKLNYKIEKFIKNTDFNFNDDIDYYAATSEIINNNDRITFYNSYNSYNSKNELLCTKAKFENIILKKESYCENYIKKNNIIVSITSYKERLKNLPVVLNSILTNTLQPFKIVLTLYKNDYYYLTNDIMNFLNKNEIELIITNIDLKSHKKYFEVMKKYKNHIIITIDDDIIYTNDLIESLYSSYIKYPLCVHARRVHKILTNNNNEIKSYTEWPREYNKELNPSFELFATTGGGTLFPPNILQISDENINEIQNCITADDIYLKYLETKYNVKVKWVPNKNPMGLKEIKDKETLKNRLYDINIKGLNDKCIKIFKLLP